MHVSYRVGVSGGWGLQSMGVGGFIGDLGRLEVRLELLNFVNFGVVELPNL